VPHDLLLDNCVRLADNVEFLLGYLADNAHREPGSGKRHALTELRWQLQGPRDFADFILVQVLEGLNDPVERNFRGEATDVMVRLDLPLRFDNVRIDRTLYQVLYLLLPRHFLKYAYKRLACCLSLLFGIYNSVERIKKSRLCIDYRQRHVTKSLLDVFSFPLAHQSCVHVHRVQISSQRLVRERCANRAIDAARESDDRSMISHFSLDFCDCALNKFLTIYHASNRLFCSTLSRAVK